MMHSLPFLSCYEDHNLRSMLALQYVSFLCVPFLKNVCRRFPVSEHSHQAFSSGVLKVLAIKMINNEEHSSLNNGNVKLHFKVED